MRILLLKSTYPSTAMSCVDIRKYKNKKYIVRVLTSGANLVPVGDGTSPTHRSMYADPTNNFIDIDS